MLFALDICVNKKALPTHSVHWVSTPLKNITPSFFKLSKPPFLGDLPPKIVFFFHTTPPKK